MKRIISCTASDFRRIQSKDEFKAAILASEGRVVMAQSAVDNECLIGGISNAELISCQGTDLILLKVLDVLNPKIKGIETTNNIINEVKRLTGKLIGINLEVVGSNNLQFESGTILSPETIKRAVSLNPDYVCLTNYRNKPENTSNAIIDAIKLVREHFQGLLIINKYYSSDELLNEEHWEEYVLAGADVITVPMPGAVAGVYVELLAPIVKRIKKAGALVSMSVATSQEGSDLDTIKHMALLAKQAGGDIYDFGDANANGIASPENILALSIVVRGKRHTYFRIAGSVNR